MFANGPGDLGSIPGRVIPKTQKMVLDASLLNTQHYKVRIKGKVEQSKEGVAPSPTPWCSSYRKGSLRVTLDYGRQLYFTYIVWNRFTTKSYFNLIEIFVLRQFKMAASQTGFYIFNILQGVKSNIALSHFYDINILYRRCPWCNGYHRRKWTRRYKFKFWTKLIAFHIALIPLGKVWIQLFSLQLWVNRMAD